RFLASMPGVTHPKRGVGDCLVDMFVQPSTCLLSREAFEAVGGFDEQLRGYEDDDLYGCSARGMGTSTSTSRYRNGATMAGRPPPIRRDTLVAMPGSLSLAFQSMPDRHLPAASFRLRAISPVVPLETAMRRHSDRQSQPQCSSRIISLCTTASASWLPMRSCGTGALRGSHSCDQPSSFRESGRSCSDWERSNQLAEGMVPGAKDTTATKRRFPSPLEPIARQDLQAIPSGSPIGKARLGRPEACGCACASAPTVRRRPACAGSWIDLRRTAARAPRQARRG